MTQHQDRVNEAYAAHCDIMSGLRDTTESVVSRHVRNRRVVYLDYPVHTNSGDHLIWLGGEGYLRMSQTRVAGRFSVHELCLPASDRSGGLRFKKTVKLLDRCVEQGSLILFHGGGNFGDLYPLHDGFRKLVIERYRDAPSLILPQSVHFANTDARARAIDRFASYKTTALLVRDEKSARFAQEAGLASEACPDMAHMLWDDLRHARNRVPSGGHVRIGRRDSEAFSTTAQAGGAVDWRQIGGEAIERVLPWFIRMQKAQLFPTTFMETAGLWKAIARRPLFRRPVRVFSDAKLITTDRLHGLILAALLGKCTRFGENSYGKLRSYYDFWLKGSPLISFDGPSGS